MVSLSSTRTVTRSCLDLDNFDNGQNKNDLIVDIKWTNKQKTNMQNYSVWGVNLIPKQRNKCEELRECQDSSSLLSLFKSLFYFLTLQKQTLLKVFRQTDCS